MSPHRHALWLPLLVACSSTPAVAPLDAAPALDAPDVVAVDRPPAPDVPAIDASAVDVPDVPDVATADAPVDRGVAPSACGALAFCDDFESAPVGGVPAAPRWSVTSPNCSGTGTLTVDGTVAHSGTRSVRVGGGGGYCDHVFIANGTVVPSLGAVVYGRLFVRFSDALGDGHVTFLTMRDAADNSRDLRLGGQSGILMWNRESDDATLPELSPTGISRSARPVPLRWQCLEFRVDQAGGTLQTWLDGVAVEGLTVDATPTPDGDARWLSRGAWRPTLVDVKLGWESYAGQHMTVWFDDVAFAGERVGCGE